MPEGEEMVVLICHGCGSEKEVSQPPKEFICGECGAVNVVPRDMSNPDACGCLSPTGFEWCLPAGVVESVSGQKIYTTAQGTKMSREEFVKTFGVDPEIMLARMRKLGIEGKPGFYNTSSLGTKWWVGKRK